MYEALGDLSLDLLRGFDAAARLRSFTAAAVELGTTQPAISQQIKRFEEQLGNATVRSHLPRHRIDRRRAKSCSTTCTLGLQSIDAGLSADQRAAATRGVAGRHRFRLRCVLVDAASAPLS
jgi:serine/threonine protein kinase HipA of HipAB toxin-antitoxin module